jgi:hypothetical protein
MVASSILGRQVSYNGALGLYVATYMVPFVVTPSRTLHVPDGEHWVLLPDILNWCFRSLGAGGRREACKDFKNLEAFRWEILLFKKRSRLSIKWVDEFRGPGR